jgi:serine/threonine protein kinase
MAPEILSNVSYHGPTTDLFAIGVVLFIMAVGNPPFN